MARIIYKAELPRPEEVPPALRAAAAEALATPLREPRPTGFPLLTLKIARARLDEARNLIHSMDSPTQETHRARAPRR